MKKFIALFVGLMFCVSLSSCGSYSGQTEEVNKVLTQLLTALEKNDEAAVMELFAPELKSYMGDKLNSEVHEMMEYFDG